MTLLSSADLAQIKADIRAIVEDTSINTTVKYRQFTGDDYYDPTYQEYENLRTDWSGVSAIKGVVTRNETSPEEGGVEVGDTKFVIMQSDVSNVLSVSDLVVESGNTYNVKRVFKDPLDVVYVIYANLA